LPASPARKLPFYLAAEEWAARFLPADEYFMAWQVAPTVICGRHQVMSLEVDTAFCKKNGIEVWRRKSGGGCVFADCNNIMFSYICPSSGVMSDFRHYTSMISALLRCLEIPAEAGGRNDVLINGRKVAGNAYYSLPGRSIVHGTMLYDADFELMSKAITPSRAKLSSHGVKSVPSRLTTLKAEGLSMSCPEFKLFAETVIGGDATIVPAPEDIAMIVEMMKTYTSKGFLSDSTINRRSTRHLENVGEIAVDCIVDPDGLIAGCRLSGDFFAPVDFNDRLSDVLRGVHVNPVAVENALGKLPEEMMIAGMSRGSLNKLILESI
ncbi:MAG: lipoyltransferase, partial [Muribaculaceae bacterium]|nr:lipoyltransferase [Muribaculaceae bacterium]